LKHECAHEEETEYERPDGPWSFDVAKQECRTEDKDPVGDQRVDAKNRALEKVVVELQQKNQKDGIAQEGQQEAKCEGARSFDHKDGPPDHSE
jgi:hypothetical protein